MSNRIKGYIILGFYLVVGVILGYMITKSPPPTPNSITIDIIKENDAILVRNHYSRNLIFEYSEGKPADRSAYRELEDVWREAKTP